MEPAKVFIELSKSKTENAKLRKELSYLKGEKVVTQCMLDKMRVDLQLYHQNFVTTHHIFKMFVDELERNGVDVKDIRKFLVNVNSIKK